MTKTEQYEAERKERFRLHNQKHLPVDSQLVAKLLALGFKPGPEADFERVSGLVYLVREHAGRFQYVMLAHYEGRFLEGAFQVFLAPKNTRPPKGGMRQEDWEAKGFMAVFHALYRDENELLAALDRIYESQSNRAKT